MSGNLFSIEDIVAATISYEGGYVNDPRDSGGETNWGITLATARRFGYNAPMRAMKRNDAVRIYTEQYMKGPGIDKLHSVSPAVCAEVYDTGVNCGPARAIEFLQRALNILNRNGSDYPDLAVDGDLGRRTVEALTAYKRIRGVTGESVLLKILNTLQGAHYVTLAERRAKDEAFIFGWFRERVNL